MKRIVFYIVGAFVAELAIIAIATIFGLNGISLFITVILLPAALFIGAIAYLGFKFFKGGQEETGKNESGK